MKLYSADKLDKKHIALLVHGSDSGRMEAEAIIACGKSEIITFECEDILREPAILSDELFAISMFGGVRTVRIRNAGNKLTKILKEFLDKKMEAFLVVFGKDLKKASSLKKLFETEANLAAIACYHDSVRDIATLIRQTFKTEGVQFEDDVIRYLSNNLGADRMVTLRELEKICLYAGAEKLTLADVKLLTGNNADIGFDNLCNAIADKNFPQIEGYYKRLTLEGTSPIAIIRIVMGYFNKLLLMSDKMEKGASVDQAVSSARPPIFYMQLPHTKKHLRSWRKTSLLKVMATLLQAERDCKSSFYPPEIMCRYYMIKIACL